MELVYGHEQDGQMVDATALAMERVDDPAAPAGALTYEAEFHTAESGKFTYGVRVRPSHANLPNRLSWASSAGRRRVTGFEVTGYRFARQLPCSPQQTCNL